MPEDTQVVNPPADVAAVEPNDSATPAPNPLEDRLSHLESELSQTRSALNERDALLGQYQSRLSQLIQAQQQPLTVPAAPEPTTQFDADTTRFVNTAARRQAEDVVNATLSKVMLRSEIYQRLGGDQDAARAADKEYQALKQNPYYAGQSDEILYALAVDRGRSAVLETRLKAAQSDSLKSQRAGETREQAGALSLPATQGNLRKPANSNPDADLSEYMNNPINQQGFRKLVANVDPLSDAQVKWGGRYVAARDAFKDIALRYCRKGIGVSGSLARELSGGNQ